MSNESDPSADTDAVDLAPDAAPEPAAAFAPDPKLAPPWNPLIAKGIISRQPRHEGAAADPYVASGADEPAGGARGSPTESEPTVVDVKGPARSPEDVARAQVVVDDFARRGLDCTVDDVLLGHALMGHVRAILRADESARNKAISRLADYSSSLGMTSAVLLAKMTRELRAAEGEAEQVAILSVAVVTTVGILLHSQLPKWGGKKSKGKVRR